MQKPCSRCKKNPRTTYNIYCKPCLNTRQKRYYKEHPESTNASSKRRGEEIRKIIQAAKAVPCKDCGNKYPPYVMDFDHLRDKAFLLATASNRRISKEKVLAEIAKCEVVCSNCHRIRTHKRKP